LLNALGLFCLVFFIYSILAVYLFKDVSSGTIIDQYLNFMNFNQAMLLLFRCASGENWYLVMFDVM